MLQLKRTGVIADPEDIKSFRAEFRVKSCALLPSLLEPPLLAFLLHSISQGQWNALVHEGIGVERVLGPGPAVALLHFVTNWPEFLRVIHEITGCGPFTWFGGRVYRMLPSAGHYDSWHDDAAGARLVGLSVNLSPQGYQGGLFQMRERGSEQLLVEIANTGLGNAILFRISENFLHRVTEVGPPEPKTAFAGWFEATTPTLSARLHRQVCGESLASVKRND